MRTEKDVVAELDDESRRLLKRVLEIEMARIHVKNADVTDEIELAVKGIVP